VTGSWHGACEAGFSRHHQGRRAALLSGTMAISETVLKDTVLMAIDEINAKGGVLGKKLEPVVVDPASNWPLFAEKAKQLLTRTRSP
jgi:urea transport system substrate-binding protein